MFKPSNVGAVIACVNTNNNDKIDLYLWDSDSTDLVSESVDNSVFDLYNPDFDEKFASPEVPVKIQSYDGENQLAIFSIDSENKNIIIRCNGIEKKIVFYNCEKRHSFTGAIINKHNLGTINGKIVTKVCINDSASQNNIAVLTADGNVYLVDCFDSLVPNFSENKVDIPENIEAKDIDCTGGQFFILTNSKELYKTFYNNELNEIILEKVNNILPVNNIACHFFRSVILCEDGKIYTEKIGDDNSSNYYKIDALDPINVKEIKTSKYTTFILDQFNNLYCHSINEWGRSSDKVGKLILKVKN